MAFHMKGERLKKLRLAMGVARRKLVPFRDNRRKALKEYVGSHYSDSGSSKRVPMNLIELAVNVYARHLVAQTPRVLATTKHMALKPAARKLEISLNRKLEEMRFGETASLAAIHALFGMAIIKVGSHPYADAFISDSPLPVGETYAGIIDLDDWVHDMSARNKDQWAFAGHRYRLPLQYVKESGLFQNTDKLGASQHSQIDDTGSERIGAISRDSASDSDEYRQYIDLWDIWLPHEDLLVTFPDSEEISSVIREVEWEGPERGPFHILNYTTVPGQTMGLPPVAAWMDMHELANRLYLKLGRQADRQKTIGIYRGSAKDDAERVRDAGDSEMIRGEPDSVKEISFGGISQENLAFAIHVGDKFSWLSGNLDALGGLSAMSETVGQDEMLTANASLRLRTMQDKTYACLTDVVRAIAHYEYNDPMRREELLQVIPEADLEILVGYGPEDRKADFLKYNIEIAPYSLQREPPQQKLAAVEKLLQNLILPAMPMLAEQGVQVNWQGVLRLYARYRNMAELEEILTFGEPPEQPEPGPERPKQAPVTTRNYVRTNRSAGTRPGRDNVMQQALVGKKSQPAETQAAFGGG